MKSNERVAIISGENINRLSHLYGEMGSDDLSRIVNHHLEVAVDEITEDCSKKLAQSCAECEYLKPYNLGKKIYYCDHLNRTDDMGKLSEDHLPSVCPIWCPLKNSNRG